MNKIIFYASMTTLVTAFGVMLYVLYLLLYPFKPIEAKQPFHILTPEIKAGGLLQFENEYCKNSDSVATLHRILIDGNIYPLPSTVSNLEKGCGKKTISVDIPDYVPAGTYHIETTATYQMNLLRIIVVRSRTEDFQIIN